MLAPILVSVYDRKESLIECITKLKKNELAKNSLLYIVSDQAANETKKKTIESIRDYIKGIEGFKKVILISREENLGSYNSIKFAITKILDKHKKIIFLEDDIRVSKYFLQYMNEGLKKYEMDERIFSISSYFFPNLNLNHILKEDVFIWSRYCPWGMATWKNRWDKIDWEVSKYKTFIKDKQQVKKFNQIEKTWFFILQNDIEKQEIAMDARINFHLFLNDLFTVYPKKNISVNRGHQEGGEHCGFDKKYFFQNLDENFLPVLQKCLTKNKKIYNKLYWNHYSVKSHFIKPILIKLKLFNFINRLRGR